MHWGSKILLNSPPQGRPLLFKGQIHHRPSLLSGQISCTEVVKYYWILHLKRGHLSLKAIFTTDHLYYQERPLLFKGHIHQRPSLLSCQISCTEVVKYYWILHLKRGHSSLKAIFTTDHLYYQERPFLFKGHIHHRPSLLSGQKSCTEVVKYCWILHLKGGHSSLKAIFTTHHLYYQARYLALR